MSFSVPFQPELFYDSVISMTIISISYLFTSEQFTIRFCTTAVGAEFWSKLYITGPCLFYVKMFTTLPKHDFVKNLKKFEF